jgi:hypothetical protein
MTATPGTVLYAPQARLVDCSSGRLIGSNVARSRTDTTATIETIVSTDLVSAKVTLVNSGPAQLQVVLNNQRFDPQDHKRPVFPPWKYNDFTALSQRTAGSTQDSAGTYGLTFGQVVRLDLRYGAGPWVKMILARVTDLSFSFATSGAQLTVTGEDMLSALRIRPTEDIPHNGQQEETILDDELRRSGIGLTASAGATAIPTRSQGWTARHQKSQTYFAFINDMAERLDCELYVDFVDRVARGGAVAGAATSDTSSFDSTAIDVAREVTLRMEPARSGARPTTADTDWTTPTLPAGGYLELRWGKSLIDFSPKLKVWDMPTAANASGSQPNRRGRADGRVTSADVQRAIAAELFASPSYPDVTPIDAITARQQFFGTSSDADNTESAPASNLDQTRARMKALAAALKKVREYMTVEAKSIGVPKLRPGTHVHILGMRPPFDGFYYITKAVHTIDANGYRTDLSLRRPGMLPPAQYLTASSEENQEAAARRTPPAAAGGGS